ncbi:GNAT family N-acetyltransferase [Aminipila terrae]|uniref:Uncharacterized protein n=1 Tax=Aminipila terrae TaxID=2697030 RepID=A0A6P1MJV3_9FIRM|nr:hypothetical protein [Aminipila terrae]QHI71295.1 hypothetical protein Ami3637_01790 [Aminipila terrae]
MIKAGGLHNYILGGIMNFNIITKYDEFLLLERDWNDLLRNLDCNEIFYSWNWIKAYLDNVDCELKNNLCIVIGRNSKSTNIILPFINDRGKIRFITNKTVDYNNILVDKSENKYNAILKAISFLIKEVNFKEINLNNFKGETELFILCDVINSNMDLKINIEESVMAPILKMKDKKTKTKNKAIKDIQRREKKLKEIGNIKINIGAEFDNKVWVKLQDFHKKGGGKVYLIIEDTYRFTKNS